MSGKNIRPIDARRFKAKNRSALLNQFVSITQDEYKDALARLSMNLLRRNNAGVGWVNKAVAKHKLSIAAEW